MAGIGFELQKMFSKKGVFSVVKAYGYAGVVCVGPMLLGMILLIGIHIIMSEFSIAMHTIELVNSMITYTLLGSIVLSSALSMVTSRFIADHIYIKKTEAITPSFLGSCTCLLVVGEPLYAIFLTFSGISLSLIILCLILFGELIIVWTEITYLTAIKDYKGVMLTFLLSVTITLLAAALLLQTGGSPSVMVMCSVCIGYGVMMICYFRLMLLYFPKGNTSPFYFLKWLDLYPQLFWTGFLITCGLFGHLVIMWTSHYRKQIEGLFYGTPAYDIPALFAFLSILITTITFVTSVEVNFYPKYRRYYDLYNEAGAYVDIELAQNEMLTTLKQELGYTFIKQFFTTVIFVIIGTTILPQLPFGISNEMLGVYRVLCVGYAFYAVGNCLMLILLYFSENRGALVSTTVFCAFSCSLTWILKNKEFTYSGIGFLIGGVAFSIVSLILLQKYTSKMCYHILCKKSVVEERARLFTRISNYYERKYEDLQKGRRNDKKNG